MMAPMLENPRILVVDDEAAVREAVASLLETFLDGARVRQAASGQAGLVALNEEAADLIVTDFKMPGMNGAQFPPRGRQSAPRHAAHLGPPLGPRGRGVAGGAGRRAHRAKAVRARPAAR